MAALPGEALPGVGTQSPPLPIIKRHQNRKAEIFIHITLFQALLLGVFQGLTEFLPVSSTAHMAIVPQLLFHMDDPGAAFSAVVQLGPIVAIILYFRNDLVQYAEGVMRTGSLKNVKNDDISAKLGWYTLLGTIPLLIFGVLLEHKIDTAFRDLHVIAISLIGLALVLWYAESTAKRNHSLEQTTFKEAMTIGLAQVLALVPGTSRSGVTITAGLLQGLDRESAARFSFLLSIPAISAAGLYKLAKVLHHLGGDAGTYVLAAIVAGIVAYVVIYLFLGYMKEHSTGIFIGYRIALGLLVLYLLHTGALISKPPVEGPSHETRAMSIPSHEQ